MSTPVQVIADYRVAPGALEDVLRLLAQLSEASRGEQANLSYQGFQSIDDPSHLVILERYTSAEGFAAHRDSEHFQQLGVRGILPLLQERTVTVLEDRP